MNIAMTLNGWQVVGLDGLHTFIRISKQLGTGYIMKMGCSSSRSDRGRSVEMRNMRYEYMDYEI